MRVIECTNAGAAEVLHIANARTPIPQEGEVLIKVSAAGVNRPDIAQREGKYPPPPGASPRLGLEVAGEVAECGLRSTRWHVGDKVCALTPGGGYAEYCVAPEAHCLPIPRGLSFTQAAAIPETFFTVWSNVFERGQLKPGEIFLVHGGTSGIGVAAIQLAAAFGARVLATAGSTEKCRACIELGAESAINYRELDFVGEIMRITQRSGVDVILDMIGGAYFARNVDSLGVEGRLVQIAFLQGVDAQLNLGKLMTKRLTLTGSTLRPQSIARKTEIAENLQREVWPLLESGKVKVVIDSVYDFADVAKAHRRMESSSHIGKIVLSLGSAAAADGTLDA